MRAKTATVTLGLDEVHDEQALRLAAARALGMSESEIPEIYLLKRSLDARRGRMHFEVSVQVGGDDPLYRLGLPHPVSGPPHAPVVVIGEGPAGLFCAYELARHGIIATVLDRGKPVQPRRHDLKGLNQRRRVDADSNYCFGEGGAGTFSDGKLYTRATKRGDVRDILEVLALHGAPPEILVDARPHIGSNKLPKVVSGMRARLEEVGVNFRFGARVVDLAFAGTGADRHITALQLADGSSLQAAHVVLATGHSARDIWEMLDRHEIALEAKPFAIGVRIEHPQPLINRIQYGAYADHPNLPNAAYRLAETVSERGVFSFCMCPGGFVVPASTEPGALVVNGMSLSKRNSPFANSGMVIGIETEDCERLGFTGPMAGVAVQKALEEQAWKAGGEALRAPASRVSDFLRGKSSSDVPKTSYQPGLQPGNIAEVLDATGLSLSFRLREALQAFGKKMRGYVTEEAVLIGVESRTSAPVRILRDRDSLASPSAAGIYPCGEGAGFAGGIVSAALDGIRVARSISNQLGRERIAVS